MRIVFYIFKGIQIFFFTFTLAVSAILFIASAPDRFDRGPIYMKATEQFTNLLAPDLYLGGAINTPASHSIIGQIVQTGAKRSLPVSDNMLGQSLRSAGESLQGLHAREMQVRQAARLERTKDALLTRN